MANLRRVVKWFVVIGLPIVLLGGLFVANKHRINYALQEAAESGSAAGVAILIERGADVKAKAANSNGDTPLHAAALKRSNNSAVMRLLIKHGADVNAINNDGDTPLHYAIMVESAINVRSLIHLGADVNAKSKRFGTPLYQGLSGLRRVRRTKDKELQQTHYNIVKMLKALGARERHGSKD